MRYHIGIYGLALTLLCSCLFPLPDGDRLESDLSEIKSKLDDNQQALAAVQSLSERIPGVVDAAAQGRDGEAKEKMGELITLFTTLSAQEGLRGQMQQVGQAAILEAIKNNTNLQALLADRQRSGEVQKSLETAYVEITGIPLSGGNSLPRTASQGLYPPAGSPSALNLTPRGAGAPGEEPLAKPTWQDQVVILNQ